MSFQIPLQKPIQPLHLYRHLLREASYLPRPCRQYVRGQIFHKFRINQTRHTRIDQHIHDGYTALRTIRAANAGQLDRMYRIALLTFGRLGEHRIRRLNAFMRPDGPRDAGAVEAQLAREISSQKSRTRVPEKTRILETWPLGKMREYLKAQKQQQDSVPKFGWPKAEITRVDPGNVIPETSVWGTPLSENGKRYRLTAWYRSLKDKVIPPMTETRFGRLRDLANGIDDGKPLQVTPRRAVSSAYLAALKAERATHWEFGNDIRAATALVERQKSRPFLRRSGELDESPWRQDTWSPLTARNLQRIFRFVYYSASMSKVDPTTLVRTTTWGKLEQEFKQPRKMHNVLFDGVDAITGLPPGHKSQTAALKAREKLENSSR